MSTSVRRSRESSEDPSLSSSTRKEKKKKMMMNLLPQELADRIAIEALSVFKSQCSSKVSQNDSTVFAAFVMEPKNSSSLLRVVSFGLGTHAVGSSSSSSSSSTPNDLSDFAFCLRDLHAEVLARRALVAFLLEQQQQQQQNNDIFSAKFHLFVSQTPCGDASIFPNSRHGARCFRSSTSTSASSMMQQQQNQNMKQDEKQQLLPLGISTLTEVQMMKTQKKNRNQEEEEEEKEENNEESSSSSRVLVSAHCNGLDDDLENVTRLKPGKGIRSSSLSCSDKIAKWISCGLEGGVAGNVLPRIDIASLTVLLLTDQEEEEEEEEEEEKEKEENPHSSNQVLKRLHRAFVERIQNQEGENSIALGVVDVKKNLSSSSSFPVLPFQQTTSSNSSSVCLLGHLSSSSSKSFSVRQLTGKDGAVQGSTPAGRQSALQKVMKESKKVPSVETPYCRLGVMRKTLELLLSHRRQEEEEEEEKEQEQEEKQNGNNFSADGVTFQSLKERNSNYLQRLTEFHSHPPFSNWTIDLNVEAMKSKLTLPL